jgi:hypothetical protein
LISRAGFLLVPARAGRWPGTSANLAAYLSLTLALPGKGGQSSYGTRFGACSLVGQLFPFPVNIAAFLLVWVAISLLLTAIYGSREWGTLRAILSLSDHSYGHSKTI